MKSIGLYILFIVIMTILLPITLTKGCEVVYLNSKDKKIETITSAEEINGEKIIEIYDVKAEKIKEIKFEEYIKGVVSAEMPAGFHLEALKAQAVAARTYAYYRLNKYSEGHPDHKSTAICNSIHCQAYLSMDQLREVKSEKWMYEYWPKIEDAVDTTKGEIITYKGKAIEPLFHSTSGGKTENSEDYFISAIAYLRSVDSPYEENAPRFTSTKKYTITEFIKKIKNNYSDVSLTKSNLKDKIEAVEKSESGRIKKLRLDKRIISGRDFRSIFNLDSTNFTISVYTKSETIEIKTKGFGHGVGMSQYGANGMAENGEDYKKILTHYYTDVEIEKRY